MDGQTSASVRPSPALNDANTPNSGAAVDDLILRLYFNDAPPV